MAIFFLPVHPSWFFSPISNPSINFESQGTWNCCIYLLKFDVRLVEDLILSNRGNTPGPVARFYWPGPGMVPRNPGFTSFGQHGRLDFFIFYFLFCNSSFLLNLKIKAKPWKCEVQVTDTVQIWANRLTLRIEGRKKRNRHTFTSTYSTRKKSGTLYDKSYCIIPLCSVALALPP